MWQKELLDAHVIPNLPALPQGEVAHFLCFETDAPEYHVLGRLQNRPKIFSASWCLWRFWDDVGYWYLLQVMAGPSASRFTTTMNAREHTAPIARSLRLLLKPYAVSLLGVASSDTLDLLDEPQDSPHN